MSTKQRFNAPVIVRINFNFINEGYPIESNAKYVFFSFNCSKEASMIITYHANPAKQTPDIKKGKEDLQN